MRRPAQAPDVAAVAEHQRTVLGAHRETHADAEAHVLDHQRAVGRVVLHVRAEVEGCAARETEDAVPVEVRVVGPAAVVDLDRHLAPGVGHEGAEQPAEGHQQRGPGRMVDLVHGAAHADVVVRMRGHRVVAADRVAQPVPGGAERLLEDRAGVLVHGRIMAPAVAVPSLRAL
jgi:hypothetical protein